MQIKTFTEAIIYEHVDGTESVYIKRPYGTVDKIEEADSATIRQQLKETQLWHAIRLAAKANPALKQALDEVILIYNLSK
jgi:hypothetical protein